jgi:hypothetical protein
MNKKLTEVISRYTKLLQEKTAIDNQDEAESVLAYLIETYLGLEYYNIQDLLENQESEEE